MASWISILERNYIIFLLRPHYNNFNKRITKAPKIYFYDSGLVCSLLEIEKAEQLATNHIKGALFERLIVSELVKSRYNKASRTIVIIGAIRRVTKQTASGTKQVLFSRWK